MEPMVCQSCGAPAKPALVTCEFCENPVSAEAARRAIACPRCKILNVEHAQNCVKCQAWLVVQCLFCSHLTAYTRPACARCNEPFAGAAERKAALDAERNRQQVLQTVGAVAPVAGSLIGGLAGAFLGSNLSSGGSHATHSYGGSSGPSSHGGGGPSSWVSGASGGRRSRRDDDDGNEIGASSWLDAERRASEGSSSWVDAERRASESDDDDEGSRSRSGGGLLDSVMDAFDDDDEGSGRRGR